jgi:hypothetical protein
MVLADALLLLLLLTSNIIRRSVWGGVHLVMVALIFGVPIECRTVHVFQNICVFVKYYKG